MKKVYEHIDFTMVGLYQSLLESEGITTDIRNYGASSLSGLVAIGQCYPELWVVEDEDYDKAVELLNRQKTSQASDYTDESADP